MTELIKYQLFLYLKSVKLIMPFFILLTILYHLYGIKPLNILDTIFVSCLFAAVISIWLGHTYNSLLDKTNEQLFILKTNMTAFYSTGVVVLIIFSLLISLVSIFFPFLVDFINHGTLFERQPDFLDYVGSFLLHFGSSLCGAAVGTFFHPGITRDKKLSLILTLLFTVLMVAKPNILSGYPYLNLLLLPIPPVADFTAIFRHQDCFQISSLLLSIAVLLSYAAIYFLLKVLLLKKIKF